MGAHLCEPPQPSIAAATRNGMNQTPNSNRILWTCSSYILPHKIQFIHILIKRISILNPFWNIFPNKFHLKNAIQAYAELLWLWIHVQHFCGSAVSLFGSLIQFRHVLRLFFLFHQPKNCSNHIFVFRSEFAIRCRLRTVAMYFIPYFDDFSFIFFSGFIPPLWRIINYKFAKNKHIFAKRIHFHSVAILFCLRFFSPHSLSLDWALHMFRWFNGKRRCSYAKRYVLWMWNVIRFLHLMNLNEPIW